MRAEQVAVNTGSVSSGISVCRDGRLTSRRYLRPAWPLARLSMPTITAFGWPCVRRVGQTEVGAFRIRHVDNAPTDAAVRLPKRATRSWRVILSIERAARLQRLIRQQRGRHRVAAVLERTSATLEHQLTSNDVLSLDASDALRAKTGAILTQIAAGSVPALQGDWADHTPSAHAARWRRASRYLPSAEAWLLPQEVATVGAIRVAAPRAWEVAPQLAVENDDLLLVGADAHCGVRLLYEADYEKYDQAGPWHLTIWGEDWMRAAESS
jgi:hypothetical protein